MATLHPALLHRSIGDFIKPRKGFAKQAVHGYKSGSPLFNA